MGRKTKNQDNPIYLIRNATALTRQAFAFRLGISLSEVKQLEQGKRIPTFRIRERLTRCCGAYISPVAESNGCEFRVYGDDREPYDHNTWLKHIAKPRPESAYFGQERLILGVTKTLDYAARSKCLDLVGESLYWDLEKLVSNFGLGKWFDHEIKDIAKSEDSDRIINAHFYCCLARREDLRALLPPVPDEIAAALGCWRRTKDWDSTTRKLNPASKVPQVH